ncbi:hypothetical protein GCK72_017667 [Caenorhabditis remanei]|uniref:SXP/RAL-2 family protein Ani s 5-like cation-binding domain-containing protein n=1 Tax=Caenorhabditis remanei TaxID=31234 RepID=A0A6A5G8U2_CAERE|nr:hypothetical protein GCK72_017667 [Caenorhabditis remanei]KAF1751113.1 hypothetical protein GCK72_017667 [Caenorhabditis remanei]
MNYSLLGLFTVVFSISLAFPFGDNPDQSEGFQKFKNLLPRELVDAYSNLGQQDKEDLKYVFRNYQNYQNEQEMIAALKQRNPSLGSRVERKMFELKRKVAGLSDESKEFVENLLATGRQVYARKLNGQQIDRSELRQIGMGVAQHYRSLSPYSQNELQTTFPQIFQFLQQARAQGLRGMLQGFFGGGGMGK